MGGIGSGGAREGAGRKIANSEPKVKVTVRVPLWLSDLIEGEAKRCKVTTSRIVVELLEKGTSAL